MCEGPHPFIPVDNTARFRLNFQHMGELCMNVLHIRLGTAWSENDLDNMSLIIKDWWDTYLKAQCSSGTQLNTIEATSLEFEDDLRVVFSTGLPIAGTNSSPGMPGGTTVAVRFTSAYSGRSKNGRLFHIGLVEASQSGNTLDATVRTNLIAAYEELLAAINAYGNDASLVIVSYCNNKVWRTTGATTLVSNVTIDQYIDSQRRRNHR